MAEAKSETEKVVPLINSSLRARQLMEVWSRVIKLDLEGEERPFYLVINNSRIEVKETVDKPVDIIILGSMTAFVDVVKGRKDVTYPVAHGQLKLSKEKIADIITLSRILRATERRK